MKNKNILQALKFTLFSISAGLMQIIIFSILNLLLPSFSNEYGVNYFIALLSSILWNFTFNRKYTFKHDKNIKKAMMLVLLFYVFFTPLSTLLGNHFSNKGIDDYLILGVTMICNFILEFLYTKYIVYKDF